MDFLKAKSFKRPLSQFEVKGGYVYFLDKIIDKINNSKYSTIKGNCILGEFANHGCDGRIDDKINSDAVIKSSMYEFMSFVNPSLSLKELSNTSTFYDEFYSELLKCKQVKTHTIYDVENGHKSMVEIDINNCDWYKFTKENFTTISKLLLDADDQLWEQMHYVFPHDEQLTKANTVFIDNIFNESKFEYPMKHDSLKVIVNINCANHIIRVCDFVMLSMLSKCCKKLKGMIVDYAQKKLFKTICSVKKDFPIDDIIIERLKIEKQYDDGVNWLKLIESNVVFEENDSHVNEIKFDEESERIKQIITHVTFDFELQLKSINIKGIKEWPIKHQKWAIFMYYVGRGLNIEMDVIMRIVTTAYSLDLTKVPLSVFMEYFTGVFNFEFKTLHSVYVNLLSFNGCSFHVNDLIKVIGSIDDCKLQPTKRSFLFLLSLMELKEFHLVIHCASFQKVNLKFNYEQLRKVHGECSVKVHELSYHEVLSADVKMTNGMIRVIASFN